MCRPRRSSSIALAPWPTSIACRRLPTSAASDAPHARRTESHLARGRSTVRGRHLLRELGGRKVAAEGSLTSECPIRSIRHAPVSWPARAPVFLVVDHFDFARGMVRRDDSRGRTSDVLVKVKSAPSLRHRAESRHGGNSHTGIAARLRLRGLLSHAGHGYPHLFLL